MASVNRAYWLYAGRVAFSRWKAQDLSLARALWGDPSVTRYITASGLMTEAEIHTGAPAAGDQAAGAVWHTVLAAV